jgi:hypothetical protein
MRFECYDVARFYDRVEKGSHFRLEIPKAVSTVSIRTLAWLATITTI